MKIIVCIKSVPIMEQLMFDMETRRVIRDGVSNEINPFDRRAITQAVKLREQFGGEVVVISMGPPQAREELVEALAMGCDRAVLISGRELSGSDTAATSNALALACKSIGFDLILCGKYSTDSDTAQVPPMVAEKLGIAQVTGVTALEFGSGGTAFTARREMDDGIETVQGTLPVLMTAAERLIKPAKVTPEAMQDAAKRPVQTMSAVELSPDLKLFGQAGSFTMVQTPYSIEIDRKKNVRSADNLQEALEGTVKDLLAEGLFGLWKDGNSQKVPAQHPLGSKEKAVWVVAEVSRGSLRPVTYELVGRSIELAKAGGGEVAVVLIGHGVEQHVKSLAAYGADTVYLADAPALADYATDAYAGVLAAAIQQYKPLTVLMPSTANGRDLAPRVAARLSLGLTGDCIGVEMDEQQRVKMLKPIWGGNILSPILSSTIPSMVTIRPGVLQAAVPDGARQALVVRLPVDSSGQVRVRSTGMELTADEGAGLDNAEVVVSVGKGVGGPAALPMIHSLAGVLGAAVGGSRPVVDAGWLPRQAQVGLTGRSISPNLYLALGISGQFNHMVGIQRAGLILAVNSDPQAPIFKLCDVGIVGDVHTVAPALEQALRAAKEKMGM